MKNHKMVKCECGSIFSYSKVSNLCRDCRNKVVPTYKQLCQNLALTESALRTNRTGRSFSTHGRSADLKQMETLYPEQYKLYEAALLERLSKPYDVAAVMGTIPKEATQ